MPGQFTFTFNDWDEIIHHPDVILPGIEKVSMVYWSERQNQIKALTKSKGLTDIEDHQELLSKPEGKFLLQKFRSVNKPYEWIRIAESPLIDHSNAEKDADLFSELHNTILILRYRNESDGKYDVLMIYFNKNLNQFGLAVGEKVLSIENKSIIGHILYHYFKNIFGSNSFNFSLLQSIRQSVQSIRRENKRLKEENLHLTKNLEEMIMQLSLQHVRHISDTSNKEYTLTDEALSKLKGFRGNIGHLPALLDQAVIFAENILSEPDDVAIRITEDLISLENFQEEDKHVSTIKRIDGRESRTIQLLDRLEKAAKLLKNKDMPLTGVNIGKSMEQPITAPAISDALKKHKSTILKLLKRYPQKWEIIRTEFRPIRNLFKEKDADPAREERA